MELSEQSVNVWFQLLCEHSTQDEAQLGGHGRNPGKKEMMMAWTRVVAVEVERSGQMFKGPAHVLNVECERMRVIQDDSKPLGRGSWVSGGTLNQGSKDCKKCKTGREISLR